MEQNAEILKKAIRGSLKIIEQDREKEIISRRFGLTGRKETLEQIGEMLSITRERVRQLEKAILIRLQIAAEEGQIPELAPAEKLVHAAKDAADAGFFRQGLGLLHIHVADRHGRGEGMLAEDGGVGLSPDARPDDGHAYLFHLVLPPFFSSGGAAGPERGWPAARLCYDGCLQE